MAEGELTFRFGGVSTQKNKIFPGIVIFFVLTGIILFFAVPYNFLLGITDFSAEALEAGDDSIIAIILLGILSAIFSILSVYCFARAALTDPGVVPRIPGAGDRIQDSYVNTPVIQKFLGNDQHRDATGDIGFCNICNLMQPRRAQHCNYCNNCVWRFDHHCPWIGNCVGAGNYRYFLGFAASMAVLELIMLGATIYTLVLLVMEGLDNEDGVEDGQIFGSAFMLVYLIVGVCFTFPLAILHLQLSLMDRTTYDQISRKMKQRQVISLWFLKTLFCGSRRPSLIALESRRKAS